jgi:hypothetical protein
MEARMIFETAILISLIAALAGGALVARRLLKNIDALRDETTDRFDSLGGDILEAREEAWGSSRHECKYIGGVVEQIAEKVGVTLVEPLNPTAQFYKRVILSECPEVWRIDPETAQAALAEMDKRKEGRIEAIWGAPPTA